MPNVTQPTVTPPSGDPPPITPYFRLRCDAVLEAAYAEAAVRGVTPDPLAA